MRRERKGTIEPRNEQKSRQSMTIFTAKNRIEWTVYMLLQVWAFYMKISHARSCVNSECNWQNFFCHLYTMQPINNTTYKYKCALTNTTTSNINTWQSSAFWHLDFCMSLYQFSYLIHIPCIQACQYGVSTN